MTTLQRPKNDLTGGTFGRLTVLRRIPQPRGQRSRATYQCRCRCGQTCQVRGENLQRGKEPSCGCADSELRARAKWRGAGELSGTQWRAVCTDARKRGIDVTLTIEEAWALFLAQNRRCALTGWTLTLNSGPHRQRVLGTASLDRIDSSKGYEPGNVQWVHKLVNIMKRDISQEDFVNVCTAVDRHSAVYRPIRMSAN